MVLQEYRAWFHTRLSTMAALTNYEKGRGRKRKKGKVKVKKEQKHQKEQENMRGKEDTDRDHQITLDHIRDNFAARI